MRLKIVFLALFIAIVTAVCFAASPTIGGILFKDGKADQKVVEDGAYLTPHRALYSVRMTSVKSGSQLIDISGSMYYAVRTTCDAYATDHRFNLVYDYSDSMPTRITSDFATYETRDGRKLDFSAIRKRNGEIYEEFRGHADASKEADGKAIFSVPEDLAMDLPAGTIYPSEHTMKLLEMAKTGKKFYHAVIFDGSDDEGPVEVNSFIGEPVNVMAAIDPAKGVDKDIDVDLLNTPAWRIRLAFFPMGSDEATSDYEMEVIAHENGVVSDMEIEYDDFTVLQKLIALEKLEPEACQTETKN